MELFDLISKYARTTPDSLAFVDDARSVTYGRLWQLILANRSLLIDKGFGKQAVVYRVKSQLKFAIDFLCLTAAGCWVIPIPSDVSEDIYIRLIKIHNISFEIDSSFLPDDLPSHEHKQFMQNESHCGIYHLTSGSTGDPKLCIRSLELLKEEGVSYQKMMSLNESKLISLSPVYHSFAFGAAYMAALVSGSSVYLFDKFIPRKAVDIIGTWHANIIIAVPVMIKAIATVSLLKEYNFSSLSTALVGAGNVSTEVREAFKKRFGIFVSSNYGSTETGGLISRLTEDPVDSIGIAMDGIEIKLIFQDGNEAAIGEEGEAHVRCRYMMSGYLGEKSSAFDNKGFFPMGDIMTKDAAGFYYIKGRTKNLINIGGKKVNPKEVEDVLLRYPGIRDCMVCKAMRTVDHEIVKAVIVGENLDENDIRIYLRQELVDYKVPSLIEFTDNIKRNVLGKIVKQGAK